MAAIAAAAVGIWVLWPNQQWGNYGAPLVLDCARGITLLAAGLAARRYDVRASDASENMVRRTRALGVDARVGAWADLPSGDFDTVLCVGNTLPHARDRVAALRGMAGALRPGGRLVLTSRNWEREQPSESYEVERGGRRGRVTYTRSGNDVDITVAVDGETVAERLTFFPFTNDELLADLRAAGLQPAESTFAPDVERSLAPSD